MQEKIDASWMLLHRKCIVISTNALSDIFHLTPQTSYPCQKRGEAKCKESKVGAYDDSEDTGQVRTKNLVSRHEILYFYF